MLCIAHGRNQVLVVCLNFSVGVRTSKTTPVPLRIARTMKEIIERKPAYLKPKMDVCQAQNSEAMSRKRIKRSKTYNFNYS